MERPAVAPEGAELWETSDQGCDIMLRHLEAARGMARHAHGYTKHALRALEDRYSKFTLILTALSRKLEPPPTTHTQI
ncbi:hypothetical protein CRUP_003575 [Coryphaenoides rupestris]|nr:hypothetical protein CRUP_003575 [Coryphaenoides rupestris]